MAYAHTRRTPFTYDADGIWHGESDPATFVEHQSFDSNESFETTLSLLAEAKPYQNEAEASRDAARFLELSRAVGEIMGELQSMSFSTNWPQSWLFTLLSVCHERKSTLVSFNYDTVIETGVETHHLMPERARLLARPQQDPISGIPREPFSTVGATDVLRHLVPAIPSGYEPPHLVETMTLLKLHGSLDWWWSPGDATGGSIMREGQYGAFCAPQFTSFQDRHDYLPSKVRFIVPPLATKSAYYQNPISKQLWRDANEALKSAEHVALIGYSLPLADAVTFAMLRQALHRGSPSLHIVNLDVEEMLPRVRAMLGLPEGWPLPQWVRTWDGPDAVAKYVDHFATEEGEQLVEYLREDFTPPYPPPAMSMHIEWPAMGGPVARMVGSISREGRFIILNTASVPPSNPQARSAFQRHEETAERETATIADLLQAIDGDVAGLLARHGDAVPVHLIRLEMNTNWAKFTPACLIAPPEME